MAQEVKATDAAKTLADEKGIDLSSVKPTGSDGQVTKEDVQKALSDTPEQAPEQAQPERRFYARINPALGQFVGNVTVGSRTFYPGDTAYDNIVSESAFEELKQAKDRETGLQLILKGSEVF